MAASAISLERGRLRVQGRAHLHRRRHGDLLGDPERPHLGRLPARSRQERCKVCSGKKGSEYASTERIRDLD